MLEIRDLRLVDAIATEGGLTRAADRLHLTQSALSHRLKTLEARLGLELFSRTGRRLELTAAGRRLRSEGASILAASARLEHDMDRVARGEAGQVRLSTGCYTTYYWLPRVLAALREERPGLEIDVDFTATRVGMDALRNARIDLLIDDASDAPEGIERRALFEDELVAVSAPDSALADRKEIDARDFADQRVLVHRIAGSSFLEEWLRPCGVEPADVAEIPITEGLRELARAGLGVAVMARWAAAPDIDAGALAATRIGEGGLWRTWSAFAPAGAIDAEPLRTVIEGLRRFPATLPDLRPTAAAGPRRSPDAPPSAA